MKYQCYFLFFQAIIVIFLVYPSCKAMNSDEEDQKRALLNNKKSESVQPSTWNIETPNPGNIQYAPPKTKRKKVGGFFFNNKVAWLTLAITGTAATIGYYYYSLLNKECHKMEGACDGAVNEIDTIMKDVDVLKEQLTSLYTFIQQCPEARNNFFPQVIAFFEKCCLEQP